MQKQKQMQSSPLTPPHSEQKLLKPLQGPKKDRRALGVQIIAALWYSHKHASSVVYQSVPKSHILMCGLH